MNKVTTAIQRGYSLYSESCRKVYVPYKSFVLRHATAIMLIAGVAILTVGLTDMSLALREGNDAPGLGVEDGDARFEVVTSRIFELIEGNMGSLIMVVAGLAAIVSAAFGAYRAAVGLLVVAVGAFVLRALVDIFFDFTPTDQEDPNASTVS